MCRSCCAGTGGKATKLDGVRAFLVVILAVALGVGCTSEPDEGATKSTSAPTNTTVEGEGISRAVQVTEAIADNRWHELIAGFDETMTRQLGAQQLEDVWIALVDDLGPYESHGNPIEVDAPGQFRVYDTPMTFANGDAKSRVAFRTNGQIAGLFLLPPDAP
jgi:hypothetical protein